MRRSRKMRSPTPWMADWRISSTSCWRTRTSVKRATSMYASAWAAPPRSAWLRTRSRISCGLNWAMLDRGASHRDRGEEDRWLPHTDGHPLAILPASSARLLHDEIGADPFDFHHGLERVSDQDGTPHGSRDFPVLDQVSLAHGEVEVSAPGVHRASTHLRGVEPLLDSVEERGGGIAATIDVGVGHARDR